MLHTFGGLNDVGHKVKMDNIFNYLRLAHESFNLPKTVLTDGSIKKSGRGVPPCVIQQELKGKHAKTARGTVKAAVLKGDSKLCNLVIVSNYDQKPIYMIKYSIPKITWTTITKKVWSSKLGKSVLFKFLWCNVSHDYNYEMNDNDAADQLHLIY